MNKLTDIIKRYGIVGCLHKIIFKVGKLLGITYIKHLAYFKELPEIIDTNALVQYQKMTMDDFRKQIKSDQKWFNNHKLKQIEGYIDKPGYAYYGIYDGDKLMCYGGVSMEFDNFIYRKTNPEAAYLFDDYTNPHYRGKGLHQKIVAIREYEARNLNKSITFAYVLSSNRASTKGFKRCGYVAKIKLIYTKIGKKELFKRRLIPIK